MTKSSQGRQNNRRQTTYRNGTEIQGNTVRKSNHVIKTDTAKPVHVVPSKKISHAARKNRDKAIHMNLGYVMFLSFALLIAGFILISYIRLQSDITSSVKNIAKLERQLNNLKLDNDEEYSRIVSSVNLDEIKRIAIQELGMTYANEGQIIAYSSKGNDYVRRYAEIPTQ